MKASGTVTVSVTVGSEIAPRLVRGLPVYFEATTDICALDSCSSSAIAFLKVLAAVSDPLETAQIALAMNISTRSLPPIIKAAKRTLAEYGDSFDRYVVRETRFRKAKPFSLYRLTSEGRQRVTALRD